MGRDATPTEELELIYRGARCADLAIMFDLSEPEVKRRLIGNVTPIGADRRIPKFRIKDAAPFLCNVVFDTEEFLKNISPSKLPPALNKAFWQGLRERQKWEEERGHLWSTERVIETIATAYKTIRMTSMMMTDQVEQETALTKAQRDIIQRIVDGFMSATHQALIEEFADYVPPNDEHGKPPTESAQLMPLSADIDFDDGFDDD